MTLFVLPKITNFQTEIRHFQASQSCQLGTIKPYHLYLDYEELVLKEKNLAFHSFLSIKSATFPKFISPQSFPLLLFQTFVEKLSY